MEFSWKLYWRWIIRIETFVILFHSEIMVYGILAHQQPVLARLAFYLPTIYSLEPSIKIENIFLQYIMKEIILCHERDATAYPLQEGTRLCN